MRRPKTLHAHQDWALHVALSASGGQVLSTGLDAVFLDGSVISTPAAALQCSLNSSGTHAALALRDGTVRVYDCTTREETAVYSGPLPEACGAALSSANVLAACYTRHLHHAIVLRSPSGKEIWSSEFSGLGRGIAISSDRIAYVGNDCTVNISDFCDSRALLGRKSHGDVGLSLDSTSNVLAMADADAIRLADVRAHNDNGCGNRDDSILMGYKPPGKYGRCNITPDARRLVAAESYGFGVWDLRYSQRKLATLRTNEGGFCNGCAMTPDGDSVVTAATDGQVRLWNLVGNVGKFTRNRETTEDIRWWNPRRSKPITLSS